MRLDDALDRLEADDADTQEHPGDEVTSDELWERLRKVSTDVVDGLIPFLSENLRGSAGWRSPSRGNSSRRVPLAFGRVVPPAEKFVKPKRKLCRAARFQIAGLDIMLDSASRPVVLELNANPSLDIHDGPAVSRLDEAVKVSMLRDAIRIAVLGEKPSSSGAWLEQPPASRSPGRPSDNRFIRDICPRHDSPLCWEALPIRRGSDA